MHTNTHTHWYFTHRTDNKQHSITVGLCCHHRIYGLTQAHRRTLGCASPYPSSGIYPRRRRNGWVKRPIKSRSPYTDTRSRTGDSERNNQHLNNNKRWRPAMQNPTAWAEVGTRWVELHRVGSHSHVASTDTGTPARRPLDVMLEWLPRTRIAALFDTLSRTMKGGSIAAQEKPILPYTEPPVSSGMDKEVT